MKNDVLLPTFCNISDNVNDYDERGLLGVAADPNFATNFFIYVYYTREGSPLRNRVARFTMSGDTVDCTTELLIIELSDLGSAGNHNGGMNALFLFQLTSQSDCNRQKKRRGRTRKQ